MSKGRLLKSAVLGVVLTLVNAVPLYANLCDAAAHHAARETGVPADVMLTITRLETGRGKKAEPWPWTVNHAGNGSWFQTEDDARSYVFSRIKRGVKNVDVGCFQINYRWHGNAFRSLDEMFDPKSNALYAARFLQDLYREFGTWTQAAGAYHSRTPRYADRYKKKFRSLRPRFADLELPQVDDTAPNEPRILARNTVTAPSGSVFLTGTRSAKPFIDFGRAN